MKISVLAGVLCALLLTVNTFAALNSDPTDAGSGGTASGVSTTPTTPWFPTTPTTPTGPSTPKPTTNPLACAACDAYPGTIPTTDGLYCACPSDTVWDGTQCVAHTYTNADCPSAFPVYNPTSGLCEKTANTPIPGPFPEVSSCAERQNTNVQSSDPYICLDTWTQYNPTKQYLFDADKNLVDDNTAGLSPEEAYQRRLSVQYICGDGTLQPALQKYHPDYTSIGFCDADQCYFGPSTAVNQNQQGCLSIDDERLGWVCVRNGNNADALWTTRTQYLADALYAFAQDQQLQDFILHCDTDIEALNDATLNRLFTKITSNTPPLINSFCVLSDPQASGIRTIAMGTTLNPADYSQVAEPVKRFELTTGKKFVELLNYSQITTTSTTCTDALNSVDGVYNRCNTGNTGSVWYSSEQAALIWSTDPSFDFSTSFTEDLLASWRSLFGTSVPNPLIAFNGMRLYIAKAGSKMVQASLVPVQGTTPGNTQAIVAYQGLSAQTISSITTGTRATTQSLPNGLVVVTLDNPTQTEWEQLTLVVRPQ